MLNMQSNIKPEIAFVSQGTPKVEILVGEEAFQLLSEEYFLSSWDELYLTCDWATVFQSREFVATWYEVYRHEYLPVVVKAETDGKLTGLLTMAVILPDDDSNALEDKRVRIVGAGHFEAEYQVWLADKACGVDFIKIALTEIRNRFPYSDVLFRYLPPHTPTDWIDDPKWKKHLVMEPFTRPLMDMSDPGLPKLFRKTEFRNKYNRLKRIGVVSFDLVKDYNEFASIMDELAIQFDFRQGAMFNKNRFRENPLKAKFLLAIFEQNLLHVTVLRVNHEIVAAVVAVVGKGWVHLGGINVHTPLYAHYYSPGFVHFLLLGQQLSQEGVAIFDLTPGGDSYKERMATRHDHVYELVFTSNLKFKLKRRLRKQLHTQLIKAGKRPMTVELAVEKKLYLLKSRLQMARKQGYIKTLSLQARKLSEAKKTSAYQINTTPLAPHFMLPLQKNNLGNLLDFDGQGTMLSRWEFLEDAMRRFEAGEQAYTRTENGKLMDCAWLSKPKEQVNGKTLIPEGAFMISGIYHHPESSVIPGDFLKAVIQEVNRTDDHAQFYAMVDGSDHLIEQALELAGFKMAG